MQKQTKQIHLHLETIGNIVSLEYGSGLTESKRKGGKYPVFGSNGVVGHHDEYSVNGPGIIVGRKGSIGEVNWSDESFWPIDTTYFVKLKNEETSLRWVYYMLSHKNLKDLNSATGIPGLNRNDVYNTTCFLPDLKEQQKIASILSNVDSLIQKTDQIIEQTRILKKGLMQRLLTKGIGHTKFKKTELGDIPEEWSVMNIMELVKNKNDIKTGPFGSSLKKEIFVEKGYKIYGQENVIPDDFSIGNYFIPESLFVKMKQYEVKPGDILISLVGTHGRISIVPQDIHPGIINPRLLKIRVDCSKIFPEFLKVILNSENTIRQIKKLTHGLTMEILNTKTIKQLCFLIPTLKEQQKITSIISNMDEFIQKIQTEKSNIETLKKGLMQQLLTGKIRVKV